MSKVLVDEQNLIDIGNALRQQAGNNILITHEDIMIKVVKTSSTPNVVDKNTYTKGYGTSWQKFTPITIPGATTINVELTYQTESTNYDYVQIMNGNVTTASGTKYGGTTLTTKTLTFTNTDTITIYFKSDNSTDGYFGYYAVVTGLDADGNDVMAPETNTFKPSDMAEGILALDVITDAHKINFITAVATNTGSTKGVAKTFEIGEFVNSSINKCAAVIYEPYNGEYKYLALIVNGSLKFGDKAYQIEMGGSYNVNYPSTYLNATYADGILTVNTAGDKYPSDYVGLIYFTSI